MLLSLDKGDDDENETAEVTTTFTNAELITAVNDDENENDENIENKAFTS